MKKPLILFVLISIILAILLVGSENQKDNACYLRIHVRANSNLESDQSVKYLVKDELVNYLTPYIANCNTKEEALNLITSKKLEMEEISNAVLNSNGFEYLAKITIKNELFPTRTYEDFTLEEGFYDAIIVSLGDAKGDNWWCVVYPPLCFSTAKNTVYKSKILEIIEEFKEKRADK